MYVYVCMYVCYLGIVSSEMRNVEKDLEEKVLNVSLIMSLPNFFSHTLLLCIYVNVYTGV